MNLFLVAPALPTNTDEAAVDARLSACIEPIADLIASHISNDPVLFAMRHRDELSDAPIPTDVYYRYAEAVRIADGDVLRRILVACGDPNSGKWMMLRSLVTCRAVVYGYDGQALVCLPTDAPPIVSPDEDLIVVEECSHYLATTDWLDGLREPR